MFRIQKKGYIEPMKMKNKEAVRIIFAKKQKISNQFDYILGGKK
tara:strand:- start:280 stop:411 length:132 start_codon:yes stop_codon:yes gene_type:complete